MRIRQFVGWSLFVVLIWQGIGCATPRGQIDGTSTAREQSDEPSRMRADVAYTVDVRPDNPHRVEVGVEVQRPSAAITIFEIKKSWGGLRDIPSLVDEVRAVDGRGRSLTVTRPKPNRWMVEHPRGARVQLRYGLTDRRPEGRTSTSSMMYVPHFDADRVFFVGSVGLMRPMHLEPGGDLTATFAWPNLPEGWEAVTSHSPKTSATLQVPLYRMRHILLYAGEQVRVLRRQVQGNEVYFALSGSWDFSDERLADFTARIVEAERSFFRDHSQPFYLVSVLPLDLSGTPYAGGRWSSGTGLHQSLATFLDADTPLETDTRPALKSLLAHEVFHNWNGSELIHPPENRPEAVKWFTEGFTDYLARDILFEHDLITRKQYLWELNRQLVDYQTNPHRSISNAELARRYYENPVIEQVAYDRGNATALLVDHAIRRHTDGEHDLRVLMQYLYNSEPSRGVPANDRIFRVAARYAGEAFSRKLERWVRQGTPLKMHADLLGPCYRLGTKDVKQADYGLALRKSMSAGTLRRVRPEGPAAKVGLEEGQALKAVQKYRMPDGSLELELKVGAEGGTTKVRVAARMRTRQVQVFEYSGQACER